MPTERAKDFCTRFREDYDKLEFAERWDIWLELEPILSSVLERKTEKKDIN